MKGSSDVPDVWAMSHTGHEEEGMHGGIPIIPTFGLDSAWWCVLPDRSETIDVLSLKSGVRCAHG